MQQPHDPAAPDRPRGRRKIPVAVYGAAVLLLLVAVLFARGFTREVGDARVSGRFSVLPLFRSRVTEQLAVTWNGLTLRFARGSSPAVRGFEAEGSGTDIVFDDGARLRLVPGTDTGGSLTLTPVDAGAAAGAAVVVPFSVQGVMLNPPPGAALAWKRSGREFLLTLPQGARTDLSSGTLTLPLSGAAGAVLRVQGVAAAASRLVAETPVASRLPPESALPTAEKLQAVVGSWTDAAWQGWSATRYVASSAAWRLADGSGSFSEDIGIALCAEAIARGAWPTAFPLWADALNRQRAAGVSVPGASCVYIGGERDFAKAYASRTAAQVSQAAAALARSDTALLGVADLVTLLADHGTSDQVRALGAFLDGRSPAGMDVASAVGFVQQAMDYQRWAGANETLSRLVKEAVDRKLLPATRSVEGGLFLDSGNGGADIRLSLAAGAALIRAGGGATTGGPSTGGAAATTAGAASAATAGSSLYRAVGRGLVVSALGLADDKGFLPASVTLSGGRVSSRDGTVAPEAVYRILPLDRAVAREIPLAASSGSASWMWTSATLVSATASGTGISLVLSYPKGVPYHFLVGGLRPFSLLKLHGIPWHSDPSYSKYSDGWDYDSGSRTLLMKITGRSDQEPVDITF